MFLHPIVGASLFGLGIAAYIIEFGVLHIMRTPFSFLIPATTGAVLLVLSAARRRSILRISMAIMVTAFTLLVWWLALVAWRTPVYDGPAQVGEPAPMFSTTLSDGTVFSGATMKGSSHSLLVFYRGRW